MGKTRKLTASEALLAETRRLEREVAVAKALSWPTESVSRIDTDKALAEVKDGSGCVVAWIFNEHTRDVTQGCFSSVSHSRTNKATTNSQGRGGPWYRTRREAFIALRAAVTTRAAETLADLDRRIAEEA